MSTLISPKKLGYRRLEHVELFQLDTLTATDLHQTSEPGIAALAFQLRQATDGPGGASHEDWFRAEKQLKSLAKTA